MTNEGKTCGNCKWGVFRMSKHATPRPLNKPGKCVWPVPEGLKIPLPSSIRFAAGNHLDLDHRISVWPDDHDCETWEAKS